MKSFDHSPVSEEVGFYLSGQNKAQDAFYWCKFGTGWSQGFCLLGKTLTDNKLA